MAHPSVLDLLAADDPAVADHVAACAACRRVVARARPLTAPAAGTNRASQSLSSE